MMHFPLILALFPSSMDRAPPLLAAPISQEQKNEEIIPASDTSLRTPDKGARVYLIGDFLYWIANQEGLDLAYKAKGVPGQLPLNAVKIKSFDREYNPGFRVGLGYRLPHDRWEARAYVTQFRTTNHLQQTADSTEFIAPNFGQLDSTFLSFSRDEGNWHVKYTLFDVELARSFAASKSMAISPFLGARSAWIHQSTHLKFSGAHMLELKSKNHYSAEGVRLGTDLSFFLMKYVCFFGQASASLFTGRFEEETDVELDREKLFSGKTKPHRLSVSCDLRAGAEGTIPLYRKEAFLTFGLTYDMAMWFFQSPLLGFLSAPNTVQIQNPEGNLTLQGVSLSTRLDF